MENRCQAYVGGAASQRVGDPVVDPGDDLPIHGIHGWTSASGIVLLCEVLFSSVHPPL